MRADRTKQQWGWIALWLALLLSGGAGLSYEVTWSRALVIPLGNSNDAAATVLIGFMLGIGAGGYFAGIAARRGGRPLALYAVCEVLLAICALLVPRLASQLAAVPGSFDGWWRRLSAILVITAPSFAMGATLPLATQPFANTLTKTFAKTRSRLSRYIGLLYGLNTLGAAVGALVTGYWGLATWGTTKWSALLSATSFVCAALAIAANYLLARAHSGGDDKLVTNATSGSGNAAVNASSTANRAPIETHALVAAGVSGFVMLAGEMLWTRVLTFVFGHDTYAFATLLAIVLLGLAAGGWLHRAIATWNQQSVLAWALAALSVSTMLSYAAAAHLVIAYGRDPFSFDSVLATSSCVELYRALAFTPVLVLVPSLCGGLVFPAACSVFGRGQEWSGADVGTVALINGLGSSLGVFVIALGLVPLAGIQGAFVLISAVGMVMALVMVVSPRRVISHDPRRAKRVFLHRALSGAMIVTAFVTTLFGMSSNLARSMVLSVVGPQHQRFLHYEEARTSTVSVIENAINRERQLLINSVNEVTTRLVHDQSFKVLGHLGPLLHDNARRGVMICLGAGISAGAALVHPLHQLDVVDLSSAVADGARHFASENNHVLDDRRLRIHINDGRLFLLNARQDRKPPFDVAIIDSTHPKTVDSWILYTREFYDLVRSRLAPGGIAVQWLPLHGLSEQEFKIIVATFLRAFPNMTLWANVGFETYGQVGYAKLVGTHSGELSIDIDRLDKRLRDPRIQSDLAAYGVTSTDELLALFVAGSARIERWTSGLPVQTDDHPIIPYATRYSRGRRMVPALLLAIREPIDPWIAPARAARHGQTLRTHGQNTAKADGGDKRMEAFEAQGLVIAGGLERALHLFPSHRGLQLYREQHNTTVTYYEALARWYPTDALKQFEAATQLTQLGFAPQARPLFERAARLRPGDYRIQFDRAVWLLNLGEVDQAIAQLTRLRDEHPREAMVYWNLAEAWLAKDEPTTAAGLLETALAWDPQLVGVRLRLAMLRLAQGYGSRLEQAQRLVEGVLKEQPWNQDGLLVLGQLHAQRGKLDSAQETLELAKQTNPYRTEVRFELARIYWRRGMQQAAYKELHAVLRYDPDHVEAQNELMHWFGEAVQE